MAGLEGDIARTRRQLAELLQRASESDSTDLLAAVEALATTIDELVVGVEEVDATNAQLSETSMELEVSYRRYRDLFDRAPEPFVVTYREGTVRDANAQALLLLRTTPDELIGSPLAQWFPPDERPALRSALGSASMGRSVRGIELQISRGPNPLVVQASVDAVTTSAGNIELRWLFSDGTASVVARRHLAELLVDSEELADELRTTTQWQATLLGAAAHDLVTPLTVVGTSLETLLAHGSTMTLEQTESILLRAASQTMKLRRLLPSLLELSRIQLAGGTARRSWTNVHDVLARVLETLPLRGQELTLELEVELALADSLELERILENLLGNAARHAPPNSTITVRTKDAENGVLLCVDDEGHGVSADLRTQIFEPFVQATEDGQEAGSSGLGLTIVAMFAAMHGGRAWVEDAPGGGASFRVLLPHATD